MLSADARGNDEDEKRRSPSTIFVPAEGQEMLRFFLMEKKILTS
jgi:hypothetical protein